MQARPYRPDIGRFATPDRYESPSRDIGLQADPLTNDRYAFAGGNPVNNVEFDGHYSSTGDEDSRHIQLANGDPYDRSTGKRTSGPRKGQGPGRSGYRPVDSSSGTTAPASERAAEARYAPLNAQVRAGQEPPSGPISPRQAETFLNAYELRHGEQLSVQERLQLGSALEQGTVDDLPAGVPFDFSVRTLEKATAVTGVAGAVRTVARQCVKHCSKAVLGGGSKKSAGDLAPVRGGAHKPGELDRLAREAQRTLITQLKGSSASTELTGHLLVRACMP